MGNKNGSLRALFSALLLRLFRPLAARTSQLLYLFLLIVALVVGSHQLWKRYADHVLGRDDYILNADKIELTFVPPWIRTDITRQAVEDGSLEGLSLAQPNLAVRVADAFALHPWVSNVNRINPKYGRVEVELEYRRPVAMVWVTDKDGMPALLPVDGRGIVLPTADFLATGDSEQAPDTALYLHIEVANENVWPASDAGSSWGDERVHGAARLAAVLLDTWQRLGLGRIVVTTRHRRDGSVAPPSYQLISRGGATIIWGSSPGRERTGEPSSQQKITRMLDIMEQNDELPSDPVIDLRTSNIPSVASRPTAAGQE